MADLLRFTFGAAEADAKSGEFSASVASSFQPPHSRVETSAQHEEISPVNKPDGVTNLSLLRPDAASTISSSSLTSLSDAQWFRTVEDLLSRVDRIQETFKRVHVVSCLQNVCACAVWLFHDRGYCHGCSQPVDN